MPRRSRSAGLACSSLRAKRVTVRMPRGPLGWVAMGSTMIAGSGLGERIESVDKGIKEKVVAGLAIGVAVAALYFAFVRRSTKIDLDPYQALGVVVAEETAKLVGEKGQVLVMARSTEDNPT